MTGTAYKDTAVFEDQDYYYQVYAHTDSLISRSAVTVQAKPVPPESISLSAAGTVSLYKNATLQLSVSYAPSEAMAKLTWTSARPKVATVDAKGLVTPLRTGTTTITVTTDNGKKASVKVKVVNPPKAKKITLNYSGTVQLEVGQTLQLTGTVEPAQAIQKLKWTSNRKKVASVAGSGLVTAVRMGTATITARAASGKTVKLKVKVIDPSIPDSVALNCSGTVQLKVGQTLKLGATVYPDTARTGLRWSSSRKRVATVAADGTVTPLKAGTTIITVRTDNHKRAKVKVKVVDPRIPAAVALDRTGTVELKVGQTLKLGATVSPDTAVTTLRWSSSARRVAVVDANGTVTAVRAGTATITVRTANSKRARVKIRVVK